jgi:hypothetical protein
MSFAQFAAADFYLVCRNSYYSLLSTISFFDEYKNPNTLAIVIPIELLIKYGAFQNPDTIVQ